MEERVSVGLEPVETEVIFSTQKLCENIQNTVRALEISDPTHSKEDYHQYRICSAMALSS